MEPITVCENVCRDFLWFPTFLSWLADLGTFLVGVAAIGALFAYPWQKEIDRRNSQREELRRELRQFLSKWGKVLQLLEDAEDTLKSSDYYQGKVVPAERAIEFLGHVSKGRRTVDSAMSKLSLYASSETLTAASKLQASYYRVFDEAKPACGEIGESLPAEEVVKRFRRACSNFRIQTRKDLSAFVGVAKVTEFDLHSQFEVEFLSPWEERNR